MKWIKKKRKKKKKKKMQKYTLVFYSHRSSITLNILMDKTKAGAMVMLYYYLFI